VNEKLCFAVDLIRQMLKYLISSAIFFIIESILLRRNSFKSTIINLKILGEFYMAHTNKLQFMMVFSVPAEHVAEGDKLFRSHAAWMERTHHRDGEKALLVYDLSKAPEMKNPMDPGSGTTGNSVFVLAEVYEGPAGLADHWKQAGENWDDFSAFQQWMGKCKFTLINGANIVHSLW
jgi:hypothetical protein